MLRMPTVVMTIATYLLMTVLMMIDIMNELWGKCCDKRRGVDPCLCRRLPIERPRQVRGSPSGPTPRTTTFTHNPVYQLCRRPQTLKEITILGNLTT